MTDRDLFLAAAMLLSLALYVLAICGAETAIDKLFERLARRVGIDPDVEPEPEDADWP